VPALQSSTGEVVNVPFEDVDLWKTRGYQPISSGQALVAERAKASTPIVEDTLGGKVTAGLTSIASGATLCLSDLAIRGFGDKGDVEYVAQQRAAHPTISTIGNIGGAVGAAVLTGGASLEGEAAGAGAEAAGLGARIGEFLPGARAGEAASAVRGTIGEALPGAVGKVAGYVAEGATAGALQGAGNYVSDVALGNRELSAEAFLSEVGNGAKWGGLAGGAMAAGERGVVGVRKLFARSEAPVGKVAADAAERSAMDEIRSSVDTASQTVDAARAEVERLRDEAVRANASSRLDRANLGAARARQQLEVANAQEAFRAAKSSADRVADAAVPAEVKATAAGSIDSIRAAEDVVVRGGDEASLHATNAAAASDASASSSIGAASQRAAQIGRMVDDVERTGARVKDMLDRRAPTEAQIAESKAIMQRWAGKYEPTGKPLVSFTPEERAMVDEATAGGKSPQQALADMLEHAKGTARDEATSRGAATDRLINRPFPGEHVAPFEGGSLSEADVPFEARLSARFRTLGEPAPSWLHEVAEGIEEIGAHERAHADLVRELGPAAPPRAQALAAQYDAAVDRASARHAEAVARSVDDAAKAGPAAPDLVDKARETLEEHRAAARELRIRALEQQAKGATAAADREAAMSAATGKLGEAQSGLETAKGTMKAAETISPGEAPAAAPKAGKLGKLANIGAVLEAARAVGAPGIPDVHDIPVVGPLLSMYLKAKAIKMALGKATAAGVIPETVEARVAAHAATAKDKIAAGIDAALRGAVSPAGRRAAELVAPKLADALAHPVFAGEKSTGPSDGDLRELAAKRIEEVSRAAANPDATAAAVRAAVPTHDPDLSNALIGAMQRKLAYLADKAPPMPPPDAFGKATPPIASAEAERYARIVRAAEHPMSILDDLRDGTLTAASVDAVKTIYPTLYAKMQAMVAMRAVDLSPDNQVPYRTRIRLGVLFGTDTDPGLSRLGALQAAASKIGGGASPSPMAPGSPAPPPPTPSVAAPPNLSKLYQPALDRSIGR